MRNNFLSKAYGGVTVARRKLNGLGLPRQWKVMTSTLLLLFTFAIGNVWAADATFTFSSIFTGSNTSATVKTPVNASFSTNVNSSSAASGKLGSDGNYFQVILTDDTFTAASFNGYINTTNTSKNWAFQFSTDGGSTWSSEVTQANDGNKTAHNIAVGVTVPSGANGIRIVRRTGTSAYVYSITFSLAAKCSAPTNPAIAGTTAYTEGQTISLTASADGATSATFTWYKGADWATASAGSSIGSAATLTINTCATSDEGTYWCNISNGTGCEIQVSQAITVEASAAPEHGITYINTKEATNPNPATYKEGIGIASFDALADVTDFHFNGWSPASIAADATTDQTISATWVAAYNVSFALGTGASGTAPAGFQKWEGATFELPGQGSMVAPSGKAFDGWKANGAGDKLDAGSAYNMGNAAVEFVAQWKSVPVTIFHWKSNTGTITIDAANGTTTGGTTTLRTTDSGKAWGNESVTYNASVADDMKGLTSGKELKPGGNANYLELSLTSGTFQEGDVIYVTGYNNWAFMTSAEGINSATEFDVANIETGYGKGDAVTGSATIPAGINAATIYARRANGSSSGIAAIKVTRIVKDIVSTVNTLADVKVNGTSISAGDLATLVSDHSLALSEDAASAPTITFNKHTVVTYDDSSTKTTDTPIEVTAADNGAGKWTASTTIDAVTYTVTLNIASGFAVTYNANGGSGTMTDANMYAAGEEVTVLDNAFTAPAANKKFNGWTSSPSVTITDGKFTMPSSAVELSAVWTEFFTITYMDGASTLGTEDVFVGGTPAGLSPDPTKDNYVFQGWSETDGGAVVADITTLTIGADKTLYAKWALDVQVTELVFSNSFKGWINGSNIEVFYMAGESAPTIVSYEGKNLKAADAVAIVGDEVVATGSDDSEKHYTLTMTAVSPLTATGEQIFDGSEGYVKTRHAWTSDKKWKMSKDGTDGRVARGETSLYIFLGAAESVTLDWGAQKVTDDVAVYVNGTFVKNIGKNNNSAIPLTGGNNMVALYSLQTSGDIWLNGLSVVAYVPTTGVTLQEGDDPISSKTIWESENFTLTAVVTPDNASDKTITWTSSDDAIATVVDGVVTGVAASATPVTITATTVDGVSATCVVTVTAAPAPCETPTINTQPATQAYCAGSEPTLTVAASVGEGTLHYAWFKDDAAIGSDAATCLVDGAGTYKVVVTNHVDGKLDASVTSANAVVTLNVAAAITTQPTNKSEIVSGSSVTLSLVATNATSYQWYSCDDAEKHGAAAISGAEAADYVFTCTANGYYYCEVGNACGAAVVSNVVSVKLEPEGCNTLASIPSASPYQYEQTGEWTLYAVTTKGKFDDSQKFKNNVKDFEDNTVNAIEYARIGMTFAKDVESLTFYATASSTGRTINGIKVTTDDITTGTPTYADVDADLASATMPGQTKQYIFTADNMLLEAGKKYWIAFSGTVDIFKICYTEALAKPVVPTLSNQELCIGENFAEIDATSSKTGDGTLSYQWFNATDEENPVAISGATDAKYTPTADGKYYVEVTNAAAGHVSNKAKSNTINVAHFAATEITTAPENQRKDAGQEATLTVVASGKNLHYAWKECATIDGTYADVAGATDAPSLTVTVTAGMDKYYKVIVSSDCGSAVESIARVEEWTELPQVAVSANTTWDMANVADAAINLKDDFDPSRQNERLLLANLKGVNNNATFNAQALMFEGQHIGRTTNSVKHLAGRYVQFNVTKQGVVSVIFASNGDNQRTIRINDKKCTKTTNSGTYITYDVLVQPGLVEIVGMEGASDNQYIRISKITYTVKETPDYTRTEMLGNGVYGTICVDHNVPEGGVRGVTVYEIAGREPQYGKIAFDEVTEMAAGVPYVFIAHGNEMALYYGETTVADPVNGNGMYGTFEDQTLTELDGIYYFAQKALWSCVDLTSLSVPANRAYVKLSEIPDVPTQQPAPGRRRISMTVNGEQIATGFENVQGDNVQCTKVLINGQLFILRGEKMYDAKGQLVK